MSTTETIRIHIRRLSRGRPFTTSRFAAHGSRAAVDRALSRIVQEGEIVRLSRGVFVRPRTNRFVGVVLPGVTEIVRTIAKHNGETVQVHGAEAARRFGLSTQAPITPVFHTSASSRSLRIGNTTVRLIHTSNRRRLQFAGEPAGLAIAALWYLGSENTTPETVAQIESAIGPEEFGKLRSANLPAWMTNMLGSMVEDTRG